MEKMASFFKPELQTERNRKFYREMNQICVEKCLELEKSGLSPNERECFKNCVTKLYKDFIPLYQEYNSSV